MVRKIITLIGIALFLSACAPQDPIEALLENCPVTTPPQPEFVPPLSDPQPPEQSFWYGSSALWTDLPILGIWKIPVGEMAKKKQMYFGREGYAPPCFECRPNLTLEGRRLDATSSTISGISITYAFNTSGEYFMSTQFYIPTEGCWEFTAAYEDAQLSFVILVIP